MGWQDDAKVVAETDKDKRAKRLAAKKAEREKFELIVETAMGMVMSKAHATLEKFRELFGKRFVPTRTFKGDASTQKEFGIKDKDDMTRRIDIVRVAKDRIEIRVDDVKYECDVIYNADEGVRRTTLDPWPTRFPNDGRALHPKHAEELGAGRAFEMGLYLGAIAVEWAKKHNYTRLDK